MYALIGGLSVIEASSFVASPTCGLYLAQMGAEVIRVDQIGGGPDYRRWPVTDAGESIYWAGLNRGKRSMEVDLGAPEGQRLVGRQARERRPHRGGGIAFGRRFRRTGRHPVAQFPVHAVNRAGLGNSDAARLADGADAQAGDRGDFEVRRLAAEFARELGGGARHQADAGTRPAGKRIEPAEFIKHGAAHPCIAESAGLGGRTGEAQQGLDERDLAGAREILARDMDRQAPADMLQHGLHDGERVDELGERR